MTKLVVQDTVILNSGAAIKRRNFIYITTYNSFTDEKQKITLSMNELKALATLIGN